MGWVGKDGGDGRRLLAGVEGAGVGAGWVGGGWRQFYFSLHV